MGNVLRSVVSREGCRHDAGSMQFRRVHLIGVLSVAGDGPDPDITGTASLRDLESSQSGRRSGQAQLGDAASILKVVPSTQIRCNTTAMRRARATIARFRPRRLATWDAHVRSALPRPRFSMTVAAWHRARLRFTSPALVMPPETSRSPDWLREGVRPTQP